MRKRVEPIDVSALPPVTLARLKAACYERDVAQIFRIVQGIGYSQRAIAMLTGQSQSEISEILGGRQVRSYDVQVRIFEGLSLPRGWGGLEYGAGVTPPEPVASGNGHVGPGVADDGVRRAAIRDPLRPDLPASNGAVRPAGSVSPVRRHRGRPRRHRRRGR